MAAKEVHSVSNNNRYILNLQVLALTARGTVVGVKLKKGMLLLYLRLLEK